jgi:hypothetical protein
MHTEANPDTHNDDLYSVNTTLQYYCDRGARPTPTTVMAPNNILKWFFHCQILNTISTRLMLQQKK